MHGVQLERELIKRVVKMYSHCASKCVLRHYTNYLLIYLYYADPYYELTAFHLTGSDLSSNRFN